METAPTTTTETPVTETAQPAAAPTLAEVKAARRAKAAPPPAAKTTEPAPGVETGDARPKPAPTVAPPETPKPAEPPAVKPPETAKIDMDPKALSEFTQLSKEVREAKAKLKETEAKLVEFGKYQKAEELKKTGKHYDAIREAGFDVDAALAELLQANPGQAVSPQLLEMKRELEALKAKDADRDKQTAAEKEAAEKASVESDRKIALRHVTESAKTYPHLAKAPELVDAAFADFTKARAKLHEQNGVPLSGEEQAKLLTDALAVHEEKWAKVFGVPAAPPPAFDPTQRGGVQQTTQKLPEKMTFAQVKAARRAAAGK